MKLNFTIPELCKSETAIKQGFNNTPSMYVANNIMLLIVNVLQPLRDKLDKPVIVTSGYRCVHLNKLIGGVNNSQHITGQAADIKVKDMPAAQLFNFIVTSGIEYDQCINESDQWVHVSYNERGNRKQCFKL